MTSVDAEEAKALLEEGAVVIDVLSPDSYRSRHLPGALNIPVDDPAFERRVRQAVPKGKRVMVYCSSLDCEASSTAYQRLKRMGYDVVEFAAGLSGWRQAGYDFEGEGPRQVQADL